MKVIINEPVTIKKPPF